MHHRDEDEMARDRCRHQLNDHVINRAHVHVRVCLVTDLKHTARVDHLAGGQGNSEDAIGPSPVFGIGVVA